MSLMWDSHNNIDMPSNPIIAGQASTSEGQGSSFTNIHTYYESHLILPFPPLLPAPSLAAVETESISLLLLLQEPIDQ